MYALTLCFEQTERGAMGGFVRLCLALLAVLGSSGRLDGWLSALLAGCLVAGWLPGWLVGWLALGIVDISLVFLAYLSMCTQNC